MRLEIGGNGDLVVRVQPAVFDKDTLARAEIDARGIETRAPRMAVAVGEEQEEPLHLDAGAGFKKRLQAARLKSLTPSIRASA